MSRLQTWWKKFNSRLNGVRVILLDLLGPPMTWEPWTPSGEETHPSQSEGEKPRPPSLSREGGQWKEEGPPGREPRLNLTLKEEE